MRRSVLSLSSGLMMDIINPSKDTVHIEDIAHGLSNVCRFTGQCSEFYSVAQHSLLVAELLPPELKLAGLMHDATEAYLGDVTTPLKRLMPEYYNIESRLWGVISDKFNLDFELDALVMDADLRALAIEREVLFKGPHNKDDWSVLNGIYIDFDRAKRLQQELMSPKEAKQAFKDQFERLIKLKNSSNLHKKLTP